MINKDLLDFLGENLAGIVTRNWEIFTAKKEAKIFRYCQEWAKFGPLLIR